MSFSTTLSKLWFNIQYTLFPFMENQVGKLSDEHQRLISVLEIVRIEQFLPCYQFRNGRPCKDRARIAKAFIAKAILKLTYTNQIIKALKEHSQLRIICGWE